MKITEDLIGKKIRMANCHYCEGGYNIVLAIGNAHALVEDEEGHEEVFGLKYSDCFFYHDQDDIDKAVKKERERGEEAAMAAAEKGIIVAMTLERAACVSICKTAARLAHKEIESRSSGVELAIYNEIEAILEGIIKIIEERGEK